MPALRIAVAIACLSTLASPGWAQTVGISPDGKKGHIHTVVRGDTLWDISATYLGTPWIWPSVWKENEDIENPHLIHPGDIIWITEGEMRRLTPEEAEAFMRNAQSDAAPAAPAIPPEPTPVKRPDPFSALDSTDSATERFVELKDAHRYSYVTEEEFARAVGAVIGSHRPNYWSAQYQRVIISVGESGTHMGHVLTIFRVRRRVHHPHTREMLGYFIEVLGSGEVSEIDREASFMTITQAYSEIQPGDYVMPYVEEPTKIREVFDTSPIDGELLAFQQYRQRAGNRDLVILDQGADTGVVPGRRFEIYRAGREVREPVNNELIMVPDDVLGELFVIKAAPRTSLALVTRANTDIIRGDRYRAR